MSDIRPQSGVSDMHDMHDERHNYPEAVLLAIGEHRRTRWRRFRIEARILRRDGLRRYVRGRRTLARFNRAVARMERDQP